MGGSIKIFAARGRPAKPAALWMEPVTEGAFRSLAGHSLLAPASHGLCVEGSSCLALPFI